MGNAKDSSSRFLSQATKILFLALTIVVVTVTADAAAPVGQTIWLRATSTGLFVSAGRRLGAVPGD